MSEQELAELLALADNSFAVATAAMPTTAADAGRAAASDVAAESDPAAASDAASEPNAALPAAADRIADHLHTLVADTDIPLARQTPWQRYEMASFGDNRPTAVARDAAEKAARHALQKQLSEQIASSRAQARDEGRTDGHAEGFAAGHAAGLTQGRIAAAEEREQLQALLSGFTQELGHANELVAKDVLRLSLDLAKAMLKTALAVKPELVLPVIDDALRYLPIAQAPLLLQLHPDDAALVQSTMGAGLVASGWRVQADAGLQRGGCRVETGSNQIDAEIGTRWQRLATALGEPDRWLAD